MSLFVGNCILVMMEVMTFVATSKTEGFEKRYAHNGYTATC
ncbi:MAG: hypothetical protein QQN47_06355 [Nitrosopumilus sp.]